MRLLIQYIHSYPLLSGGYPLHLQSEDVSYHSDNATTLEAMVQFRFYSVNIF
jgi:hypothetical protein